MSPKNLHELENRLGDALDSAARTIPDHVVRPEPRWSGERQERHRRTWVVAGVAAAAVAAAVAVPVVISDKGGPETAGDGTAACATSSPVGPVPTIPQQKMPRTDDPWLSKLPFGPPPGVPYTLTASSGARGFLQDGNVRVPLPANRRFFSWGRVECGWLGALMTADERLELGVLETSGEFRSFGTASGDGTSLSPDGRQAAFIRVSGAQGELVIVDVATGRKTASTPIPPVSDVLGWNSHGIWFAPRREGTETRLWRPGSEPVRIDTGGARLTAWRTHDRMLLDGNQPGQKVAGCLRVVVLAPGDKLTEVMRQCSAPDGSLSPDGQVLVADNQAFRVPNGSRTGFNSGSALVGANHETIWEDARHLLSQGSLGTNHSVTVRCDVVSGDCQRIADGPDWPALELGYR